MYTIMISTILILGQSNSALCVSDYWVNSEYHRGIYDHDLDDAGHDDDDEGDKDDVASLQDFQEVGNRQTARQAASHPGAI